MVDLSVESLLLMRKDGLVKKPDEDEGEIENLLNNDNNLFTNQYIH